mmetsp:Transcript_2944/g.8582  ORF Transcript_2944/g.8582 Transcript_2944/m.8582 type:complete len:154 (-) Transcript_2944:90-551(-)|eukprot:CAMPEP_0194507466 /NCGR_PEP_ID=MMETSP0253-20130528/37083_1 /TAXON_ID=2966 /ORGANISM="Noctiluca scintillans" /LENGTH=153 /DNA_ID=CAMNT_0039350371 /DNA_START=95 /DNA_END=556 /DNA_ORIENTATION=-
MASAVDVTPGDVDEEDFTGTQVCTAEDTSFDHMVSVLQDIVISEEFQGLLSGFLAEHCHHFEDKEENKLIYTTLFQTYSQTIESFLEEKLATAIDGFSMEIFMEELEKRGQEEIDVDVLELLVSLADFESFKQQMLDQQRPQGLSLQGVGCTA